MYPQGELTRIAADKAALGRRIARRRVECSEALAGAVEPLGWLDRAVDLWRRISPVAKIAAVPLALVAKRLLFPRAKLLGSLLRWGPLALGVVRSFSRARR